MIQFTKKYPISEYFGGIQEDNLQTFLENTPHGWNTYFLWQDSFDYELYQHGADFYLTKDYNKFICTKVLDQAMKSTEIFYEKTKQ